MKAGGNAKLGNDLVAGGLLSQKDLEEAVKGQRSSGKDLYDCVVEKGFITEDGLAEFIAGQRNLPLVVLEEMHIEAEVVRLIPEKVVRKYMVVPVVKDRRGLTVAIADPFDFTVISDIEFASGCVVSPVVAKRSEIRKTIERLYEQGGATAGEASKGERKAAGRPEPVKVVREETGVELPPSAAEEETIVKVTDFIISEAISKRVSDIHIEPYEDELRVRYRIDGVLHQVLNLSPGIHPGLSARIKAMSDVGISERRRFQDGRLRLKRGPHAVDMRLNTIPTVSGEKLVLSLVDEAAAAPDLGGLGLDPRELALCRKAMQSARGMIVITGPSGSGKTTTLYAMLHALNSESVNIMTAEDPVEYSLRGINQVQIRPETGVTFASAVRSFLRQDPDVIAVGELPDFEVAELAVRAAQAGCLVLSTLPCPDAMGAVNHLVGVGIAPFLLASGLLMVIAQRLVRRICPDCTEEAEVPLEKLLSLDPSSEELECHTCFQGRGCEACDHTGYRGRTGLYEVVPLSDELRELLAKGTAVAELRKAAAKAGVRTVRESGIRKAMEGSTTIDEVLRVTAWP